MAWGGAPLDSHDASTNAKVGIHETPCASHKDAVAGLSTSTTPQICIKDMGNSTNLAFPPTKSQQDLRGYFKKILEFLWEASLPLISQPKCIVGR